MMEDHLSWSLDVGRSLVVSSDLDHSYLKTLNIPGAIRAFGLNTVASINVSAGIIGLRGRPGIRKLKDMFANVYLIHDCQHPCVGDSWGSKQGLGKAKLTHPRLAVDPSQC